MVMAANAHSPHLLDWTRALADLNVRILAVNTHQRGMLQMVKGMTRTRLAMRSLRRQGEQVIVQAHGAGRSGLIAMLGLDPHGMTIVHGSEILRTAEQPWLYRNLTKVVLRMAGTVIITSEATRVAVTEACPPANVRMFHPGIDWDVFKAAWTDRAGAELAVGSIRRILPLYNTEHLVSAFSSWRGDHTLRLLRGDVPADDPYLRAVASAARHDKRTTIFHSFLGRQQLVDWYGNTDISVSLANSDQLSSSILEALASGCVVLVSDLPAYSSLHQIDHVIRVPTPVQPPEVRAALERAAKQLAEPGERSVTARQHRAELARQAFESTFGGPDSLKQILDEHLRGRIRSE